MAYLDPARQPPITDLVEPLSIADEQAEILRHVTRSATGKSSLRIDELSMSDWELRLLKTEALVARDVRDASLTLLRARAAELRLRRWLGDKVERDRNSTEAAARLLDQTLADIGSAADDPACMNAIGLEEIARGLDELYARVSSESLRLAGNAGGMHESPTQSWFADELEDDAFELQDPMELPSLPVLSNLSDALLDADDFDAADVVDESEMTLSVPSLSPGIAIQAQQREPAVYRVEAEVAAAPIVPAVAAVRPLPAERIVAPPTRDDASSRERMAAPSPAIPSRQVQLESPRPALLDERTPAVIDPRSPQRSAKLTGAVILLAVAAIIGAVVALTFR